MLSEVPEGWSVSTFGDEIDFRGGSQPPKSTFVYEPTEGYVRLLQIRDFENDDRPAYIPEQSTTVRCTESDILIARYGASLGRICRGKQGAYNVALVKLILSDRLRSEYAYYWLNARQFQDFLVSVGSRSAQAGFNKSDLAPLSLAVPPLPEQKRIAEILSSVDESIQATQSVIDQAERVKKGLMEDLLTGGLGSEAIARGEVPEGWSNSALMNVCKMYAGGTPNRKKVQFYQPAEVPWVKSGEVNQGVITKTEESISHEGLEKSAAKLVPKDTPLLAMYGATAGKVGWLSIEAATNQAILACEPMPNVASKYIYYLLQQISQKLIARQQGGAQPNLSKTLVSSYQIALPPLPEQKRIAEILSSVDDFIQNQRQMIEQHQVTKKGLMDDLLTGRVRTV